MFETWPYLRLYYGASGDMPAHGVQGLAGERVWHGISLWQLHSHNSSARSKSSDVLCRWAHVACLLKNQPMLVCNWGDAYPSWCQYSDCKLIVRIEL